MDKQLSALTGAAEYLSAKALSEELDQIKEALDSKLCYISFVGHFSAGKSKLINNLLGMDILPCGRMEVTPVMTYIRYGKNNAYIHYFSGKEECVDIGEIKNICQHTNEHCDEIEYIDISVENSLLLDGMILIDTPGLNTTIIKHEKLFDNTLMRSTKIVYVIGKSPSLIDIEKLKMICENKCDFIIVRTHCDEIKSAEETFEQVKENDLKIFKEADFNNICCYVSNESDSGYFQNIDQLRDHLVYIGNDIQNQIELAAKFRYRKISERCITLLTERKNMLITRLNGDNDTIERKKKTIEKGISKLKNSIRYSEAEIENITQKIKAELDGAVKVKMENEVNQSADLIRTETPQKPYEEWMCRLLHKRAVQTIHRLRDVLYDYYDDYMQNIQLNIAEMTEDISASDLNLELEETAVLEIDNCQSELLRTKQRINNIEAELSTISGSQEYSELQRDLAELEQELVKCSVEYSQIPPYTPQMILVEDNKPQPSQIAKAIGNIADWVTLLIPGEQIVSLLGKMGVVKGMAKFIGGVEKATKIIKNGDTIKDTAFALKHMTKTYATKKRIDSAQKIIQTAGNAVKTVSDNACTVRGNSNDHTIFDYMTISYWAGKLGEKFDRPPKYIVDQEYEREYKKAEDDIRNHLVKIKYQQYEKKCQMKLFATRQEQLEAEKQLLIDDCAKIETEMKNQEAAIRINAEKNALQNWKNENAEMFEENMKIQICQLLEQCKTELPIILAGTKQQILDELRQSLSSQKASLTSILNYNNSDLKDQIEQTEKLVKELESYECAVI